MRVPASRYLIAITLVGVGSLATATTASAVSSRFGCYSVTAAALNVRARAWSKSDVVATLQRGQLLAKRRRFCAIRGFWCPVRTANGINGWADKRYLEKTKCK